MQVCEANNNKADFVQVPGFEISHMIAKGGMAKVYLAQQKTLGRQVALKIMDDKGDESFAERFLNEGRLIASLHHPNVITIHDLGLLDDGRAFISMEYIDGGDLESRLRSPISEAETIRILKSLAESLQYIHEHDVIHRDIKPANILFRKDGSLVLTDFGIAKQLDNTDVKLTRDGQAVGSPGYMSPEQAQAMAVDNRTDIYSVGVIFAEMLMGKNMFEGDSYIQTSMNHIQMDIPALPMKYLKYQRLLNRMLAKDPEERFANAAAIVEYLDQLTGMYAIEEEDESASDDTIEFEPITGVEIRDESLSGGLGPAKTPGRGIFSVVANHEMVIFGFFLLVFLVGGGFFLQHAMQLKKVNDLLDSAQSAYSADRLMLPENNNAYYYYGEVLKLDPENIEANKGMQQLVQRYTNLAESALQSKNMSKFDSFVERGLSIDPQNARLLALKKRR